MADVVSWQQSIPITKKTWQASSPRRFWESDKKGVLTRFNIKIRNVEKNMLKVRHKNISKMEKTKSTMSPLDMNLRIQTTWRGNNYMHGLDWFWVRRLFRALMCRWMGDTVVPVCLNKNEQDIKSINSWSNVPELPERLLHSRRWVSVTRTSE